jgi:hypothetical protein
MLLTAMRARVLQLKAHCKRRLICRDRLRPRGDEAVPLGG